MIAIGSMSKAFWAGLRIGWIRASPTLIQRLALARATVDVSSPVIEQLVATELLADPDAVLVPQRATLRARRDALAAALRSDAARLALPAARRRPVAVDRARRTAQQRARRRRRPARVRLAAGPRFGLDGAFERFLRIPYTLAEAQLVEAVERLAVAWLSVASDGGRSATAPPALVA